MTKTDVCFTVEQLRSRLDAVKCTTFAVYEAMELGHGAAADYSLAVWLIENLLGDLREELSKMVDDLGKEVRVPKAAREITAEVSPGVMRIAKAASRLSKSRSKLLDDLEEVLQEGKV